jgi:hypothetical protein
MDLVVVFADSTIVEKNTIEKLSAMRGCMVKIGRMAQIKSELNKLRSEYFEDILQINSL